MYIETDRNKCQGICEIFPEGKKERKLLYKLYESCEKERGTDVQLSIGSTPDAWFLTIYKNDNAEEKLKINIKKFREK